MRKNLLTILLLMLSLTACHKDSPATGEGLPMSFSDGQAKAGLSSIFNSFKVWASAEAEGGTADLMPGYRVNFDASQGWTYTDGEGTEGQELQYWNASASRFIFFAGAPAENVKTIDGESLTLNATSTTSLSGTSLFSDFYIVRRTDYAYGNVVNLNFRYAQARINLSFKYVSGVTVNITGLKLIPPAAYATEATLDFNYNRNTERVSLTAVTPTSTTDAPVTFPELTVPENSDVAIETSQPWYMIPDPASKGEWKLSATINGELKETRFTISKAWEPGRSYLYRFEYSADANLVFLGTETELFVGKDLEDGGKHDFD